MSKVTVISIFGIACFFLSIVQAARDWDFRVGLQYWKPDWSFNKSIYSYEGDTKGAYGPDLFVGYKDFGLGFNYYTASFDVTKTYEDSEGNQVTEESTDKSRTDFDLYATYRFLKYFQAILGYKSLKFEKEEQAFDLETKVDGGALGVAGG